MFSSRNDLIGTPKGRPKTNKEFTPIGMTSHTATLYRAGAARTSVATGSPGIRDLTTSSFSALENTPQGTHIFNKTNIFPSDDDDDTLGSANSSHRENLVGRNTVLVKKQSDKVTELQNENWDLRVQLNALKKNLVGLPSDTQELIGQSAKLRSRNMELESLLNKENADPMFTKETYETKLQEYEIRMQDLKIEKADAEQKRQSLADELSELQLDNKELDGRLRAKDRELLQREDEVIDLQNRVNLAEEANSKAGDQLDAANRDRADLQNRIDDLQDRLEDLQHGQVDSNDVLETQHDRDSWRSKYKAELQQIDQLKGQIGQLQGQIDQLESDNRELRRHNRHSEESQNIMKAAFEDLDNRFCQTAEEKAALQKEYADVQQLVKSLQKSDTENPLLILKDVVADQAETLERCDDLEAECARYKRECQDLRAKLVQKSSNAGATDAVDSMRRENQLLQSENERLKYEVYSSQQASQTSHIDRSAQKELSDLRNEKLGLVRDYQQLEADNVQLQDHLEQLQVKCNDYSADIVKLTRRLDDTQHDFDTYRRRSELEQDQLRSQARAPDTSYLERSLRQQQDECVTLQRERDRLTSENLLLSNQLTALRASTATVVPSSTVPDDRRVTRLKESLNEARDESEQLRSKLARKSRDLEDSQSELRRQKKKSAELTAEKDRLAKSVSKLERRQQKVLKNDQDLDDMDTTKEVLQRTLDSKESKLERLVSDYNSMKNELLNRLESVSKKEKAAEAENVDLKEELERLQAKEAVYKQIHEPKTQYAPQTPPQSPGDENRLQLLEAQRDLYRIKLHQLKDVTNDLRYANGYLQRESGSKKDVIDRNTTKLKFALGSGSCDQKPLTFGGVASAVLAVVRLKARLQAIKKRKAQEQAVKQRIVSIGCYNVQ